MVEAMGIMLGSMEILPGGLKKATQFMMGLELDISSIAYKLRDQSPEFDLHPVFMASSSMETITRLVLTFT